MIEEDEQLQSLVRSVSSAAKYKQISPDLIEAVGRRELQIRPSLKEAVKATKSKLHQVAGAYQVSKIDYDQALKDLQASAESEDAFRQTCCQIMRRHASTRERLPLLDDFFNTTLAGIGPVESLADIACGLNPLAWPWMPFDDNVKYMAYDIYKDAIQFLNEFMPLAGMNGRAEVRDVVSHPPSEPVDLALILKTLPCLEHLGKTAVIDLLDAIQAKYLLISYPVASLGGRKKGMVDQYDAHFKDLAVRYQWGYERFEFASELAFLVG